MCPIRWWYRAKGAARIPGEAALGPLAGCTRVRVPVSGEEHVYRPDSQSHLVRDLRRDFEGVLTDFADEAFAIKES